MCGIYAIFSKSKVLNESEVIHLAKTTKLEVVTRGACIWANNNIAARDEILDRKS